MWKDASTRIILPHIHEILLLVASPNPVSKPAPLQENNIIFLQVEPCGPAVPTNTTGPPPVVVAAAVKKDPQGLATPRPSEVLQHTLNEKRSCSIYTEFTWFCRRISPSLFQVRFDLTYTLERGKVDALSRRVVTTNTMAISCPDNLTDTGPRILANRKSPADSV